MSTLLDGIINYLDMKSTGALMVSGEWGCGKSYHIENAIIPALKDKDYKVIKVSLFGIKSVNDIPIRIAENYEGGTVKFKSQKDVRLCKWIDRCKLGKSIAKGGQIISSVTWFSNFLDVKELVSKHSELLYKLIPKEKTVIFLDDVERAICSVDIHTLLGAINAMVEQRGYKVVVITNNTYIQKKEVNRLEFKEKVIEKTLVYEPEVVDIYKEICKTEYEASYRDFMLGKQAIAVVDPRFGEYQRDAELQTDLRNIRIVKFALSHYNKIYEICDVFLKNEDKILADAFRLSLWASTVGLSIEYKKDRLTYKDREQFSTYVDSPMPFLQHLGSSEEQVNSFESDAEKAGGTEEKKDVAPVSAFGRIDFVFSRIVRSHGFPVIVSPLVFDFVTAGASLDKEGMKALWDEYKIQVERNNQNPANALLNRLLQSKWSLSNEEMEEALLQLAQFVEDGAYSDNMSYVNAATILQHMSVLTPFTKKELEIIIKTGIDKMYTRITSVSVLDDLHFDVSAYQIPPISKWVVEYEKKKMDDATRSCRREDIKEACRQFNEELESLKNRLVMHYGSTKIPDFVDYPILSHISYDDIVEKVNNMQPQDVMALYDIINNRFRQRVDPKVYDAELSFVRNLYQALEQRNSPKKKYSDILIEDHLIDLLRKILNQK